MTLIYPPDTDWSCYGTEQEVVNLDAVIKARAEALAWYTLARLCAWRIGVAPTTIRPCSKGCNPMGSWMEAPVGGGHTAGLPLRTIGRSFTPHLTGGNWVNSCGCGTGDCSCTSLSEVLLPGPVGDVVSVSVDGVTLDRADYRVDNGYRLVRTDGGVWPACQDMAATSGAGVFEVTYYQGAAPNEMTRYAAGLLAAEFYRACSGNGKCKLPKGVTSVVRRGVTIEINTDTFEGGVTGIAAVDAVIGIYNPNHLKDAPRILSPDSRARGRRSTWLVG